MEDGAAVGSGTAEARERPVRGEPLGKALQEEAGPLPYTSCSLGLGLAVRMGPEEEIGVEDGRVVVVEREAAPGYLRIVVPTAAQVEGLNTV